MTRWYRRYASTVSDPKLAEAALIAECSKSVVIATWDAILESACEANDQGKFRATSRNVAATLSEQHATVERVFAAMATLQMIENGQVIAWAKRQYLSDSSTERSRKHREAKKKVEQKQQPEQLQRCATLQEQDATPPDTDTDTEAEKKESKSAPGARMLRVAQPKDRGSRLSADWVLPDDWYDWARTTFPGSTAEQVRVEGIKFANYWSCVPGAKGVKLDWKRTWQNRCYDVFATAPMRPRAGSSTANNQRMGLREIAGAYSELVAEGII